MQNGDWGGERFVWGDREDVGPYSSVAIRLLGGKIQVLSPRGRTETRLLDEKTGQIPNPCCTEKSVSKRMGWKPGNVMARTLKSIRSP